MTFVVPFDGSGLSEAGLARASEFGRTLAEDVVAVTVVPHGNADYAREKGWLGADERFDREAVLAHLEARVADVAPDADFEAVIVDRWAPPGTIAKRLRRFAHTADASLVFIGSARAGRLVTSVGSIGGSVAAADFDVVLVRRPAPSPIETVEAESPYEEADFEAFEDEAVRD